MHALVNFIKNNLKIFSVSKKYKINITSTGSFNNVTVRNGTQVMLQKATKTTSAINQQNSRLQRQFALSNISKPNTGQTQSILDAIKQQDGGLQGMLTHSSISEPATNKSKTITNKKMLRTTKINEIVMLGTHDSGTYAIKKLKRVTACQIIGLVEQAKQGAQYFDLRVRRDKGVWKFYHGERGASLGGANSPNQAIPEVKALFQYAAEHPENIFIFKFHFDTKGLFATDNPTTVKRFIDEVSSDYRDLLIKKTNENDELGNLTLKETLHQGNNIAMLVNHAGKLPKNNKEIWDYKENTCGGWGKTPSPTKLVKHLERNLEKDKKGRILVSQTNLPAFIPPSPAIFSNPIALKGLQALAKSAHKKVATSFSKAVRENNFNPGIISMDFIGTDMASDEKYRALRDWCNAQHMPKRNLFSRTG